MPETTKVKRVLEAARTTKPVGASQRDGQQAISQWAGICNDPEASVDLRAIATTRRRELEAAVVSENAAARETALAALGSIAQTFQ